MIKQILIPIAAFALTASTASAWGPGLVGTANLNLTEDQRDAFEEARRLHQSGNLADARQILGDAGIDEDKLNAFKEATIKQQETVRRAVLEHDYKTFHSLVTEGPVAEVIDTEDKFNCFATAQDLLKTGHSEQGEAMLSSLGLDLGPETKHSLEVTDYNYRSKTPSFENILASAKRNDFSAFRTAMTGTPLADLVTNEAAFAEFRQAHLYAEGV